MSEFYFAQWIARTEHELMMQSLARVPDYDVQITNDQPDWTPKQARRLLSAIGNGLHSLGEQMKRRRDGALAVSLKDHEGNSYQVE